jgi:hypothetical protein
MAAALIGAASSASPINPVTRFRLNFISRSPLPGKVEHQRCQPCRLKKLLEIAHLSITARSKPPANKEPGIFFQLTFPSNETPKPPPQTAPEYTFNEPPPRSPIPVPLPAYIRSPFPLGKGLGVRACPERSRRVPAFVRRSQFFPSPCKGEDRRACPEPAEG